MKQLVGERIGGQQKEAQNLNFPCTLHPLRTPLFQLPLPNIAWKAKSPCMRYVFLYFSFLLLD
jgi:hypothetical protein